MKIKTLGLLAALGMSLSSLTVWSLTTPSPGQPPLVQVPAPDSSLAVPHPTPKDLASRFVSGTTLMVEGRLGFDTVQAGRENENYVFVDVTAGKLEAGANLAQRHPPLNLAIVIDRSGSMGGQRMQNAILAAKGMIERLRDGDVVSLVTYNTQAHVAASTEIDRHSRVQILGQLNRIMAQGDTCISCGLETASELLGRRSGMVNQILLLSDGEATAGVKSEAGFRRIAAKIQQQGSTISTIGVDVDYNERVMSAIAEQANGRHHFVENASKLSSIFDAEFKSLSNTLADEAELSVRFAPGVRVLKVYDRSHRNLEDRLIVPLGAFSSGDEKTLLVKVSVPAGGSGSKPVAEVQLDYRDLVNSSRGKCEGSLRHTLVRDPAQLSTLDPLVASRVERSETAGALLGANELIKQGKADQALELLAEARLKKKAARRTIGSSSFASATKVSADLEQDLAAQEQTLATAEERFGHGAGKGGMPSPTSKRAKAAVRANQSAAHEAAF